MGEAEVGGGGSAGDKGPGEAATSPAEETVVWSPEVEVCLFHAMLGHKPVGVNRHFHMICIRDKFSQNIGRQVPSKVIWDHLSTMYDMQALHESEILPFPNSERNFVLPEEIIQEVREGKVMIEEEMKEEMKEDVDPHSGADDGECGAQPALLQGHPRAGHSQVGIEPAVQRPRSGHLSTGWVLQCSVRSREVLSRTRPLCRPTRQGPPAQEEAFGFRGSCVNMQIF
uniref:MRG domain binding protein n=1 Tax=Callithrix jacchus TaxID=9483 RepID=A0A8I3WA98_CALJA